MITITRWLAAPPGALAGVDQRALGMDPSKPTITSMVACKSSFHGAWLLASVVANQKKTSVLVRHW